MNVFPTLTIGSRASRLARWQSDHVAALLQAIGSKVDVRLMSTRGDRILDVPLAEIGDKGLFTEELDRALIEGSIDLAVHSLKDLPTEATPGLVLAAVCERAAPGDAFVAPLGSDLLGLNQLPLGARIGTSSLRRRAQLLAHRPDLKAESVRGNVETRLGHCDAGRYDALLLAEAGLRRLDLGHRVTESLPFDVMLPAVGQGALGIVAASNRPDLVAYLKAHLEHTPTRLAVMAERAFLRRLEGGCQVPIGAFATVIDEGVQLEGCIAALDGTLVLRDRVEDPDPQTAGVRLAEMLLARGGNAILGSIRSEPSGPDSGLQRDPK